LDGVFRRAIRALQWNAAIRQRAPDLDNHPAIARQHPFQRGECAVNVTEVGHFSHAAKFLRLHFLDRGKDGRHRVVDPDVDGAQLGFDLGGCCFNFLRVCNIHRNNERHSTKFFDLAPCRCQSIRATCNQSDPRPVSCKFPSCCASDAC
jgi:hypothetical protein